jgi:hypothetical protein
VDHLIDGLAEHVSVTQHQLSRTLEAQRHVAMRMSSLIVEMPDYMNELLEQSGAVMRTVNDYLSSMADMQEMMANCIQVLMVELGGEDEE